MPTDTAPETTPAFDVLRELVAAHDACAAEVAECAETGRAYSSVPHVRLLHALERARAFVGEARAESDAPGEGARTRDACRQMRDAGAADFITPSLGLQVAISADGRALSWNPNADPSVAWGAHGHAASGVAPVYGATLADVLASRP